MVVAILLPAFIGATLISLGIFMKPPDDRLTNARARIKQVFADAEQQMTRTADPFGFGERRKW